MSTHCTRPAPTSPLGCGATGRTMTAAALELPPLETARLRLEPFAWRHSAGVFKLWSNADVCRYSGAAFDYAGAPIRLPARSAEDSDKIVDFFLHRCADGKGGRWAMVSKDTGEFVGMLGLNAMIPAAELAYHLHPAHWGHGFATEACVCVLAWLMRHLDILWHG